MKQLYFIVACMCMIWLAACSDMNDVHDIYLKNGETVYIGRVDSIHVFSGRERVKIRYWVTDPRAKHLEVLWNHGKESAVFDIPAHDPLEGLDIMIGENGSSIAEGDYTFTFYTHDDKEHRSIRYEQLLKVYGAQYELTLNNRIVKKLTKGDNELTIEWGGSNSDQEIGVEVFYTDLSGKQASVRKPTEELGSATKIVGIDLSRKVTYCTWYKPREEVIDDFHAAILELQL